VQVDIQLCIVHQIKISRKFLSYKATKDYINDLKLV